MSRIGNKPVFVPSGTEVTFSNRTVTVKGPQAKTPLTFALHKVMNHIDVKVEGNQITVTRANDEKQTRAFHGLVRAMINNMVVGASKGFEQTMEVFGVGFKVDQRGKDFVMDIGFNAPVIMPIPEGVIIEIKVPNARGNDTPAVFTLKSPDKHILGQFAANIRRVRPPEPYKGKGIRYLGEHVRRKEGKPLVSGG